MKILLHRASGKYLMELPKKIENKLRESFNTDINITNKYGDKVVKTLKEGIYHSQFLTFFDSKNDEICLEKRQNDIQFYIEQKEIVMFVDNFGLEWLQEYLVDAVNEIPQEKIDSWISQAIVCNEKQCGDRDRAWRENAEIERLKKVQNQIEKEKAAIEEEERILNEKIESVIKEIKTSDIVYVSSEDIERIFKKYEIHLHIRTIGWMRSKLVQVKFEKKEALSLSFQGKKGQSSEKIWEALNELTKKIA